MRVLIADRLPDSARTKLQSAGIEVVLDPSLADDTLTAALREHDPAVLVVRSTRVTADHVAAGRALQLVIRAGAGVNTIDLAAASARGVFVANCPGTNSIAVAELTMAHILNADRRVADNVADLRAGSWRKKEYSRARGLAGRVLGVIGCGAIGAEVISRAQAFGMDVIGWSPSLDAARATQLGIRPMGSAVDVAQRADVLSVHVALTPATRGLIGEAVFAAMRPGTMFVNTSRGEVVDEAALMQAVREKRVRAGLDVFCDEPGKDGDWRTDLAALDGVYGTHHIGASTEQAQEAVAADVCRIVLAFRDTGNAPNCVNLALETPASHLLVVRHADHVGVLAAILDRLRQAGINVQRMENVIFTGDDGAACARIQLEGTPAPGLVDALRDQASIFDAVLLPLPAA
ncbi:MAG: phosphoglycerate dehydrogenase [Planctomycetota bacterium]